MKKIIIIASVILICLITVLSLVLRKKPVTDTSPTSLFPTGIALREDQLLPETGGNLSDLPIDIARIAPVETEDFKLKYSYKLNKIVVEKKTPLAEEQFLDWVSQNQMTQLIENSELVLMVDQGKNPDDLNPLVDFFNTVLYLGQGVESSNKDQSSGENTSPSMPSGEKVYFAQCDTYGSLPLPDGCTLCQAGCGPTTVAMIAASYLGSGNNPKTVVDTYGSKGYLLGCSGSRYSDAYMLMRQLGLKTTDYLVFNAEKADTVVPELRGYLNAGWTFFALANFCNGGCGHYFWIVNIDGQNNIIAYDPAYGRYQIPYNENSRYPYPLYRLAFGVKK